MPRSIQNIQQEIRVLRAELKEIEGRRDHVRFLIQQGKDEEELGFNPHIEVDRLNSDIRFIQKDIRKEESEMQKALHRLR